MLSEERSSALSDTNGACPALGSPSFWSGAACETGSVTKRWMGVAVGITLCASLTEARDFLA